MDTIVGLIEKVVGHIDPTDGSTKSRWLIGIAAACGGLITVAGLVRELLCKLGACVGQ